MKSIFLSLLLFVTFVSIGQTYSFSKKIVKASVQTDNGREFKIIDTYEGPHEFIFETPNDPEIKKIFTLLKPEQTNEQGLPIYALMRELGYTDGKSGVIYKKSIYLFTEIDKEVMVLTTNDNSSIVIFFPNETVWEFTN